MKKIFLFLLIFVFLSIPSSIHAQEAVPQTKTFGSSCSENTECKSGFCGKGTDGRKYCACDASTVGAVGGSISCTLEFGKQSGETWSCGQGGDQNLGLGFCKSNLPDRTKYPVGGASNLDILFNSAIAEDEVKKLTSKPTLKINIPGLNFSDPKVTAENGTTYLSFPLLGEYIKAIYRVGIAVAGIISVIMLIVAGFLWSASGGNPEIITKQKQRIEKAVIGLIIAVGSYTILFSINPRLTEFGSLKVEYIKPIPLDEMTFEKTSESNYGGNIPNALSTPELEKLFTAYGACFDINPGILKGIALAESGLNVAAGAGKKYQGLFQMDTAYCSAGISEGQYPSTLALNDCDNRIQPEINTAAAAATIKHNLSNIQRACPSITVDDAMLLLYTGHNNGPGVMNYIINHKGCTEQLMHFYVRQYYDEQPGGTRHGVDANYGEQKLNYGKKVVGAVRRYNVNSLNYEGDTSLCPKTTNQRVLTAEQSQQTVQAGNVQCGSTWANHKVLALGDSNTEFNPSYADVLKSSCSQMQLVKEGHSGKNAQFLWELIENRNLQSEGFTDIIVWAGVNNVNNAQEYLEKIYRKANQSGIRVIAVTITPWEGYGNWSAANQVTTNQIDSWIRGGAGGAIGNGVVIDVYDTFEDPANPDALNPQYARDQIHLNAIAQNELAKIIATKAFP